MWFVELENVGEASWAICREQGREDPGPRTQDRYILMGKYEEEEKKRHPESIESRNQDFSPHLCPFQGCVLLSVTLGGRGGSSHET